MGYSFAGAEKDEGGQRVIQMIFLMFVCLLKKKDTSCGIIFHIIELGKLIR